MSGVSTIDFSPPRWQWNGQLQTLLPAIFRKPTPPAFQRERFILSDGDFVDLDWIKGQSKNLALLSHGLEGNSDRPYIKGMAEYLHHHGMDILAWNCRSCSGEMNRSFRLYQHGEVEDISEVIAYAVRQGYEKIWLSGFSMGANISLNYLAKKSSFVPAEVQGAVVCSAPLDLEDGVKQLHRPEGAFYRKRFFKKLEKKIRAKEAQYPGSLDLSKLDIKAHWIQFDRYFSAPLSNCKDEVEFWDQASPKNFMHLIKKPVLIVNSENDPLLGPDCYQEELISKLKKVKIEIPKMGGHVGFSERGQRYSWFERRAWAFIKEQK